MKLINTRTIKIEDFTTRKIPPYAILSHTWGEDEVTYRDLAVLHETLSEKDDKKLGLRKIHEFCKLALLENHDYVWIDSCCIDSSNSAELTEAINSMFRWYADATVCYAYLSDYDSINTDAKLGDARWFGRGWTLQELVASSEVKFYDAQWNYFGTRHTLRAVISRVTGIGRLVLKSSSKRDIESMLAGISIAKRMSWAAKRKTTKKEDIAYCLLGIFGVNMPLIYGEGSRAFIRLQEEIMKDSNDLTLFGWQTSPNPPFQQDYPPPSSVNYRGILATDPVEFSHAAILTPTYSIKANPAFTITNKGIYIKTALRMPKFPTGLAFMSLNCHRNYIQKWAKPLSLGISLAYQGDNTFVRAWPERLIYEGSGYVKSESAIYLAKATPDLTFNRPLNELYRGAFVFDFDFQGYPIRLVSAYPEGLWERRKSMFIMSGVPNFTGFLIFGIRVRRPNSLTSGERFVVACGLGKDRNPWVSMGKEYGSRPLDTSTASESRPSLFKVAMMNDLKAVAKTAASLGYLTDISFTFGRSTHSHTARLSTKLSYGVLQGEPIFRVEITATLENDIKCCL